MARKPNNNVRAGIFALLGLAVIGATVFLIGSQRSFFARKHTLNVRFDDASGLVVGAPVRLAGVNVGTVSDITFSSEAQRRDTVVSLAIEDRFMGRVRTDSVAFIDSKGLLGDKLVNLTVGDPSQPGLNDGDFLKTRATYSIEGLARTLDSTLGSIDRAARTAGATVDDFGAPALRSQLQQSLSSLAAILRQVEDGPGLAHTLIYQPKVGQDAAALVARLNGTVERLDRVAQGLDTAVAKVNRGEGTLGSLVHGDQGVQAIEKFHDAAEVTSQVVREVRDGEGLLHALVYEPEMAALVRDLATIVTRMDGIVSQVEQGRGTVGGLVMDPTVYEDLKTVLGNIERNTIFKQLIRLSIKEGEPRRVDNKKSP